jgi:predicted N-acetyltransferase YhbS
MAAPAHPCARGIPFIPEHKVYRFKYDVPAEVFMVRELSDNTLQDHAGTVHYHEEFNKL